MAKGDIILQGKDYELDFTITDSAGDAEASVMYDGTNMQMISQLAK